METTSFVIRDIDTIRRSDAIYGIIIEGLSSKNEVLQYLIDHWGRR